MADPTVSTDSSCPVHGGSAARVRDLRRGILADLIAVKGHLDTPYPDDPRWTPWTRFVERDLARVDKLAGIALDALHGRELARLDAENERRLAERDRPCVLTGDTCQCLPGSVGEAHCYEEREQRSAAPAHGFEILDACCGGRMWWWDKAHPLAVYMDRREALPGSCSHRPNWSCEPDIIADFRAMPFESSTFQLVVFDPPHLVRDDPTATMRGKIGLRYGALARDTEQDDLRLGFAECWRVLAPGGTLVFKWAGPIDRVKPHFPATPIVGTRVAPRRTEGLGTRWFVFYKPLEEVAARVAA